MADKFKVKINSSEGEEAYEVDVVVEEIDCEKEESTVDLFKFFGNIRFVMLPLFFTAMGALFLAYLKVLDRSSSDVLVQTIVLMTGMVVSSFFVFYEVAYSEASSKVSEKLPKNMELKHSGVSGCCYIFMLITGVVFALACTFFLLKEGASSNIVGGYITLFLLGIYSFFGGYWFGFFSGCVIYYLLSMVLSICFSTPAFCNDKKNPKAYIGKVTSATSILYFLPGFLCLYLLMVSLSLHS